MTRLDLDQIDRDVFDEATRERDRQREPAIFGPRLNPLVRQQAFKARVQDSVNAAHAFTDEPTHPGSGSTDIVSLQCPACKRERAVHVPADSDGERIDCFYCGAPLMTCASPCGVELGRVTLTRGGL